MNDITITVTPQEAQAIMQTLGQLPTSSGVFPLLQKVATQVAAQTKSQSQE